MSVNSAPGTLTLYDSNGNPVAVTLTGGVYELAVSDDQGANNQEKMILLLTEIRDILEKIQEDL